jgi:hypothetical protein
LKNEEDKDGASLQLITAIAKPCPKCGIQVDRVDGCNHMTCQKCANGNHYSLPILILYRMVLAMQRSLVRTWKVRAYNSLYDLQIVLGIQVAFITVISTKFPLRFSRIKKLTNCVKLITDTCITTMATMSTTRLEKVLLQ